MSKTITFFHFNEVSFKKTGPRKKRRQSTESTVGFSKKISDEDLGVIIENFYLSEVEQYIQIDFAKTKRNPKDAPNRTLAKTLVRERIESSPVTLSYRIYSVHVTSGKIEVNLSLSEGDTLKAGLAGLHRFPNMTITMFKTSGRVRLEKYNPPDAF